ncbi:MAG: hypothetical protein IKP81_14275 [Paludibacteraceae bacterium]|nr:hypothetical protein [Paludibacteraceae bacterium]MBP3716415.1 hypothetical protein [Paludibacteraceae bacterium]MBR6106209.1 hypothetical protein [Paludibacteraceae bacterium]
MLKIFLLSLGLIAIAVALLGIKVFFTKKGKFPNTHVSGNKYLRDKGIFCVQTQDRIARNKNINKKK